MTSRRVDIAQMLAQKNTATAPKPDQRKRPADATATGTSRAKRTAASAPAAPASSVVAKWRQCEPKTFYVWPDSVDRLQALARRLQRERPKGQGERITMATLVRVAITALLEHSEQLAGVDESELLASYRKAIATQSRR